MQPPDTGNGSTGEELTAAESGEVEPVQESLGFRDKLEQGSSLSISFSLSQMRALITNELWVIDLNKQSK